IKLMTDGILLAEIQSDRYLNQYDTLIIDEAHERSLNIDFLLGYLKQLLPRRPDLKLIVTSATIDPERFSRHFADAPIIGVEGRTWPVEVRYETATADQLNVDSVSDEERLLDACETLAAEGSGDILVFLPGEREIRDHLKYLTRHLPNHKRLRGTEVLPLFARLSQTEQNRIFASHDKRRIVLATNVAETSLTVPGIRYVVDFGLARMSRYSVRSKVQRLPIEKISQASANQRKGRCGREAPGICIRLYSEDDFEARPEFTEPEILRTNLAAVILQMEAMQLGHVESFPFVESPESKYVNDGYRLLHEISAVDDARKLTKLGRALARLPIDPRLARMLFAAREEGCVAEILTIVSALSVQDPRERPMDHQQAADEQHAEFNDPRSDFVAWLNLHAFLEVQQERLSGSRFRKMCQQRFLSWVRIREWRDVRRQLTSMLRDSGFTTISSSDDYDKIHRALLTGLLANVAIKTDKQDYLGTRNRKLGIFPGSGLFKSGPKWLVSAEISQTSRLYARTVASIQVSWIERAAEHLLKYAYYEPHWHRKRGHVGAYARSTLFGLEINPKKRVNYGPINPRESRDVFIREALVEGRLDTKAGFLRHNLDLVDDVRSLEDKSRRRDILVDSQHLYAFYDRIVPEGVYSKPSFETWRETYEEQHPRGLYYDREQLLRVEGADAVSLADFPDHMEFSGIVLPLSYHFDPNADDDGVTLTVPATVVNRVSRQQCEWLVPGLLEEKIQALLRALPKHLRRNYVPVPDVARSCMQRLQSGDKPLLEALSHELLRAKGSAPKTSDWNLDALSDYLTMNFRLIDQDGNVIEEGRDLKRLQTRYAHHVEENLAQNVGNDFERDNIRDWNFGDLPNAVEIEANGVKMQGYPALTAEEGRISLRLFSSENVAEYEMHYGLRALYKVVLADEVKYMRRKLPGLQQLCIRFAPFGSCEALTEDIVDASIDRSFILGSALPRRREEFTQRVSQGRPKLLTEATSICALLERILDKNRALAKRLDGSVSLSWIEPAMDIREQLSRLIFVGFVSQTPSKWLARYPAYLEAIDRRLDAIDQSPDKDRRRRAEYLPLWEKFHALPAHNDALTHYESQHTELRWLLEELRVSVFAQAVGTQEKVSLPRIEKKIQALC
ncbi:MAG TPA: ATP-dependent RNA helicase HrpA, partial [Gammaproteobacteria bacterium]|nr:ATP-dependent RNA helicase HrpA [Gammaproteobacteria bacterium]